MQNKNNNNKCFSKVFIPFIHTHIKHLMNLVLLSYLSPQFFFKIKPFAGLFYVLLNYSIIIVRFCLSTDTKIKNMATYKLYKTAKSQTFLSTSPS